MEKSLIFLSFLFTVFSLDTAPMGILNPYDIVYPLTSNDTYGLVFKANYKMRSGAFAAKEPIKNLTVTITYVDSFTLRVKITDTNDVNRFFPPQSPNPARRKIGLFTVSLNSTGMGITVKRKSDGKTVFHLDPSQLFNYTNSDISFINNVRYPIKIMGFGERVSTFFLQPGTYTMWARDRASPYDNGQIPGKGNMYSVHPFFLAVDEDYNAFGGAFINANAQDAIIASDKVGFRTTGGIIDYYIFIGPTAAQVIQSYHSLIGFPTLIPYWGYGWHQSRFGWHDLDTLKRVTDNYHKYKLPLDAMWSDIDYMYKFQDFTVDYSRYNKRDLQAWISGLHLTGKHFVPIIDAGIAVNKTGYLPYSDLEAEECYIQDPYSSSKTPLLGRVWPNKTAFVDWLHPQSKNYWVNQLTNFHKDVKFSGIWLDMNEVANFVNGDLNDKPTILNCTTDQLSWCPGDIDLNEKSLDIAAKHYHRGHTEFNMHSLYGFMESIATHKYFTETLKTRPFIISRSSFPGHGKYASKWLGDNWSEWRFLEHSITGVYNFQMFGIPFVGADVCGFMGSTTEEMCSRWMQLGTLYPFSRNHNNKMSIDQYPWSFGSTLNATSNLAIRNKYMLFLYIYSGMFRLSQRGGMFFKPAFMNYPKESLLYQQATSSFMLGDALIVHPTLIPGVTSGTVYFPDDAWFNLYDGTYAYLGYDNTMNVDMRLPGLINIHARAGSIIPLTDTYSTSDSLFDLRKSSLTLVVIPDGAVHASGFAIFDDGLSADTIIKSNFTEMSYVWSAGKGIKSDYLNVTRVGSSRYKKPKGEFEYISTIKIYNCVMCPRSVKMTVESKETLLHITQNCDYVHGVCIISFKGPTIPSSETPALYEINYFI